VPDGPGLPKEAPKKRLDPPRYPASVETHQRSHSSPDAIARLARGDQEFDSRSLHGESGANSSQQKFGRLWCNGGGPDQLHWRAELAEVVDGQAEGGVAELFEGRHFDREVIILCVGCYLRFKLICATW